MIGGTTIYRADLQRVGAAVSPSLALLGILAKESEWQGALSKVKAQNSLGFRSSKTLEDFLLVFKHRYLDKHPPLPDWILLCKAVSVVPYRGATQLLFPYVLAADPLLKNYVARVKEAMLVQDETLRIGVTHVLKFLSDEAREHRELVRWSEKTRIRWAWRCLAALKAFGILSGTPLRMSIPSLLPDIFAFFLLGLVENDTSVNDAIDHPLWSSYLLDNEAKKELLAECASRGWVYYDEAGPIRQITLRYPSVEAWLDARVARTRV